MAMTYFELFEIPVQLKVNTVSLSKKFFELSKKYHPDYFANENDEAQSEALEKSAFLNKAWKTFQNPDATIKYVLQEKGLLEEEEKYELPPAFLMEVLEINEQLMDAGDEPVKDSLELTIKDLQTNIYEPVKEIVENYKEGSTTEEELLQVKEYYYKKKYLDRIYRQLSEK
ncbi:MAG: Fe-S protein assembly co-chaperone HscB [Chitinophagaceae bacterium]|jgi:molecular chaperone HscB|nr:Fe-S protein assembly co-chaperone HscB [Chitinophagaceae bacterium]MBK8301713.1 Fe-S protein assembly co-chaperone HscB [Chitinophagaceae bacterium]MBK9466271.1 Fe-S protein assembly co-chaperone HscB [Chitinophagaceae bacterium]MBK9661220.1 Fe-S protein assembly co-chaperone HscB [Chitinophagaceae bacterium]MBL0069670.1 Fe-S protein assembly co-chaperone HscB [Chitinophagaceae bacterium]